ncbi:MAG: HAMP domain-containing protein, partial [Actinomycetia bacterium]|nr:HAMP domain-containing protein [Actinomycetes bacterium]
MHLKLQARYSVVIFSIIICIVTVLSVILLFQFKTSMNNLSRTKIELMSKKLLEQINKRGEVMTSFLVENIKNPLYLYDMQTIYELLSTAAEQKDVLFIYVYDAEGKIVHDGDEKIPMFGRLLDDEVSRRALRLKGGLTTQIEGDILRISASILIGETLLGGITTGLSLKAIRSEIDRMNKRLNEMRKSGLNRSFITLIITTFLFIVVGMLVSVIVSRRLIHPIKDLSNYASAVGKGDYEVKISNKREDEIGDLINSFNRMSRDLQHKEEALLKSHNKLEQRVEERTIELQQQIKQREKAEESLKLSYEKLKDTQSQLIQSGKLASIGELASGVAHELNQPLMVIRGRAQLIQRKFQSHKPNANELSEELEPINRNTKRMMNIINHLRIFSRQSQSEFKPVDVNKIIEDSFLMVDEQLKLRN